MIEPMYSSPDALSTAWPRTRTRLCVPAAVVIPEFVDPLLSFHGDLLHLALRERAILRDP